MGLCGCFTSESTLGGVQCAATLQPPGEGAPGQFRLGCVRTISIRDGDSNEENRSHLPGSPDGWCRPAHVHGAQAADAFPSKPIRIVMGFPAGGPLDQHARLLTDKLQGILGQPVVVDYKPGAGGSVGAQDVMRSPADGYTLMLANTGVMVINPRSTASCPTARSRTSLPLRVLPCSRWPCWSTTRCLPRICRS